MFSELHDCKIPECHDRNVDGCKSRTQVDRSRERERENNSDESFLCLTSFYVSPTPVLLIL